MVPLDDKLLLEVLLFILKEFILKTILFLEI